MQIYHAMDVCDSEEGSDAGGRHISVGYVPSSRSPQFSHSFHRHRHRKSKSIHHGRGLRVERQGTRKVKKKMMKSDQREYHVTPGK